MIFNITKNKCIAYKPFYALSMWHRIRGMIGRNFAESDFDAMVFEKCNMIHSCFMSTAIDVIFVNRDNVICGLSAQWPPWRLMLRCHEAYFTLETPAGTISRTQSSVGDMVDLRAELDNETLMMIKKDDFVGTVNAAIPLKDSGKTI